MKNIILYLSLILINVACSNKENQKTDTPETDSASFRSQTVTLSERQLVSADVEVGSPKLENISRNILLQGSVDLPPQNLVQLSFPLGGYIRSTDALPGKAVKKGEVLAVIEDMQLIQLQQDYLTAKANLEYFQQEFERQRSLNESKASSDKIFQQAKAEMDKHAILMSALGEKLKLIGINPGELSPTSIRKEVSVKSPINGYIARVNVTIGKITSPTDILFELIDPSDIHLALKAFEKDVATIKIGQKVVAYSNSDPSRKYNAKVFLVNRVFDENNSITIHCHFEAQDARLIPGMFMNAELSSTDVRALVVPEEAVVRWENKNYVFIEDGKGEFKMIRVRPGISQGGRTQIEGEGITSDTRLVTKNAFTLLMKINASEENEG